MKKLIGAVLTICFTCIMCAIGQPMSVRADTSESLVVNECQDISRVDTTKIGSYAKIAQEIIDEGKGSPYYNKNYAFTLSKPAYVAVCVYSVVATDYSNLGNIVYSVTNAPSGVAPVTGSSANTVSKKSTSTQYLLLNPGTYYVHVELADDSCQSEAYGYFRVGVLAQYLDVTMGNTTKAMASPVTLNATSTPATGAFTATQRELWYSFYLAQNSYVNINTMTDNVWHKDIGKVVAGACATTLMDGNGKEYAFWNTPQQYGKEYTEGDIYLEKGTYYVRLLGNNYYSFDNSNFDVIGDDNYSVTDVIKEGLSVAKGAIRCGGNVRISITASVAPPITVQIPSDFKAERINNTSFKCLWNEVMNADGYVIEYSTSKSFERSKTTTKTNIAAGNREYIVSQQLKPGTIYYVRMRAKRIGYNGDYVYGPWVQEKVNLSAPILEVKKPSGLKVSNITTDSCSCSYSSVVEADGYQLQCATSSKFTGAVSKNYKNYTYFRLTKLKQGFTYYCRVRAWRYIDSSHTTKKYSAWSNFKKIRAKAKVEKLSSPTKLSVSNVKINKIVVKFKNVKKADYYQIYISTDKKFKKNVMKNMTKKTNFTSKKLKLGKTYYVKVRACSYTDKRKKHVVYSPWVTKKIRIQK